MKRVEIKNKTLYNHLQNKLTSSAKIVDAVVNEAFDKKAIYYFDRGNIHRPNRQELQDKFFICPKCKSKLAIAPNRLLRKIYICTGCGFKIDCDKVLSTMNAIEEYQMKTQEENQNG